MKVLFIHHSVGRYVISAGGLRGRLRQLRPDVELWDHDYNDRGMSDGHGRLVPERLLPVPDDNTDVDGVLTMVRLIASGSDFGDRLNDFDMLIFKSCFPNNRLPDEAAGARARELYLEIASLVPMIKVPVVLLTTPPLVREKTSAASALRARELADWMKSDLDLGEGFVLDVFGLLAGDHGLLRNTLAFRYRKPWPLDSHPNGAGSRSVAGVIAQSLSQHIAKSGKLKD